MKTSPEGLGHAAGGECRRQKNVADEKQLNACVASVQPGHQNDADDEEGDGDGEEVGCRYAV